MRKRTSLRRWKARCRLGRRIPREAIEDRDLMRWFAFNRVDIHTAIYVAVCFKRKGQWL